MTPAAAPLSIFEKIVMKRFIVLVLVVLVPGLALAEDARRLRVEASVLVHAAEAADTIIDARERKKLLEEARGKLLEIRERYPSESERLSLYLEGKRVTFSSEDLKSMIALADLDVGKLREVLGRSLSPTAIDENGWTDLHWAAVLNLPELAKGLLDAGADIGAQLTEDREPLSGSLRRSLTIFGIDSKGLRRTGGMPMHYAALSNATNVLKLLIERGVDIDTWTVFHSTPLHFAASRGATDAAKLLIERGANILANNIGGITPLHYAASRNASDVAALLIERGADMQAMDAKGRTPLHFAARWNASDVAALLIKRGADIQAMDVDGDTPQVIAAENNSQSFLALLKRQ